MIEYLLVFLGGAIPWLEIALVVPLGIISGLSPVGVMIAAFSGNLLTVLFVIFGFEKVKEWMAKRKKNKEDGPSKKEERGKRLWNKYGMPGIALLGPFLIGSHLSAFIGLVFGAKKRTATLWMVISIALWTIILGVLTAMGFDFFVNDNIGKNLFS